MIAKQEAQNPLILRCNRLIEAFAKSDDERDFYLDRLEGFIVYLDLDKADEELIVAEKEIEKHKERYCLIPKLTFYETKKIMEGFVNEKVYDIDTKEKLLDIIQSKEARENFLDFIYDHHSELEKWQIYYQERSRIRIIEWLRNNHFHFVFEEDLDLPAFVLEKIKKELFQAKASKEVLTARKMLSTKAKTYYSNEALNPRPKRGRPPKQALKAEVEHQITTDIYITVPSSLRSFLFTPDSNAASSTFSSRFGNEDELYRRLDSGLLDSGSHGENLNQKLSILRTLSNKWNETENAKSKSNIPSIEMKKEQTFEQFDDFDDDDDEDDNEDDDFDLQPKSKKINGVKKTLKLNAKTNTPIKGISTKNTVRSPSKDEMTKPSRSAPSKKPVKQKAPQKVKAKVPNKSKANIKAKPPTKNIPSSSPKKNLRPLAKLKKKT